MMRLDYNKNFYTNSFNRSDLLKNIDRLFSVGEDIDVRAFPCYISSSFYDCLKQDGFIGIKLLGGSEEVLLFEQKQRKDIRDIPPIKGRFFIIRSAYTAPL